MSRLAIKLTASNIESWQKVAKTEKLVIGDTMLVSHYGIIQINPNNYWVRKGKPLRNLSKF